MEVMRRLSGPDHCRPRPPSALPDPRTCGRTVCRPRGDKSVCTESGIVNKLLFDGEPLLQKIMVALKILVLY
jgi:hypothetical protein